MKIEPWHLGLLLVPSLILLHLYVAPFTKVEESFNLQATHDFLNYGLSFKQASARIAAFYDHVRFPGAVPRTFIGALALAGISNPLLLLAAHELPQQQLLVRGVLGILNGLSILFYTSGVRNAYGKTTASWYVALQASQFHLIFYASRTLPNTFAFALTTAAQRFTLPEPASRMPPASRLKLALYILTLTAIIFRSEIALLLGGYCLQAILRSNSIEHAFSSIRFNLLPPILTATVAGLLLTVSIDTFMWRSSKLIWPEAAAFISNVFPAAGHGGASAWGTSPWHWYLTSAIPRLLPTPLLLAFPLFFTLPSTLQRQAFTPLLPCFTYATLYSLLPHKETRFLFPVLPPLTTTLALLATYPTTRLSRSKLHRFLTILLMISTLITFLISHAIILPMSALAYPGGQALDLLHVHAANLYPPKRDIHVHLTNLALQTGVTRFLEHPVPEKPLIFMPGSADGSRKELRSGSTRWWYDKSGNETGSYASGAFWKGFEYVVVEDLGVVNGFGDWEVVGEVLGLGRPSFVTVKENERRRRPDGVVSLLGRMYGDGVFGRTVVKGYEVLRDVLLKGKGFGVSLTRGRWIDWIAEPALVILKRRSALKLPEVVKGSRATAAA